MTLHNAVRLFEAFYNKMNTSRCHTTCSKKNGEETFGRIYIDNIANWCAEFLKSETTTKD